MIPTINTSRNYAEFMFYKDNRPVRIHSAKFKKLKQSMETHGWVPSWPATVHVENGKKYVIDGQNRITAAKELGIAVVYVTVGKKYDIAEIAEAFRPWNSSDFASCHANKGNKDFQMLLEFSNNHKISPTRAIQLLIAKNKQANDSTGHAAKIVRSGEFKFERDGEIYAQSVLEVCKRLPKALARNRGINAAVARVLTLDQVCAKTLMDKIDSNQGSIIPKGKVEDYVYLLESVYNKRNKIPVPISMLLLEKQRARQ